MSVRNGEMCPASNRLSSMPGPVHLLELKDALALNSKQMEAITAIYGRMREAAVAEGERFIEAERALEKAFRSHSVTEASLERMLADIERSRARLRFIHLSAHLGTPNLLTEAQVAQYAALRGYHVHRGGTAHAGHGGHGPKRDSSGQSFPIGLLRRRGDRLDVIASRRMAWFHGMTAIPTGRRARSVSR